jgi:hypothetical protein
VDDVKKVHRTPRFIGLEVPDKMPASGITPHFRDLSLSLLDAIFSDIGCSKFDHSLYNRGRMGLADGDEFDLVGRAATVFCGG